MKKIIIFILLVIIFIGGLFMIKLFNKNSFINKKINNIKLLEYSVSDGRRMYGSTHYKLTCDDKCILESNLDGMEDDKFIKYDVDKDYYNELIKILNSVNVYSWNGFDKSDSYVLDGESYSFKLDTGEDTITTSGYMKYPKNFRPTINKIIEIFDTINKKNSTRVYDYDYYKGLNIDNVVKVEEVDNSSNIEYTDSKNINRIYNIFTNTYTVYDLGEVEDGDITRTFKFTMNDGKIYEINETWNGIVINNNKYVINYFPE